MTYVNTLRGYTLVITTSAEKELKKTSNKVRTSIYDKLDRLVSGQQGLNVKQLVGYPKPTYRLRVGSYRIMFEVHKNVITVLVLGVKHRKHAYR